MAGPTSEPLTVLVYFVPQSQIDTMPPEDLVPVLVGEILIPPMETQGSTTLAAAPITETGVIFAQLNESNAQAVLTITGA
jgi:hypothetical protein